MKRKRGADKNTSAPHNDMRPESMFHRAGEV